MTESARRRRIREAWELCGLPYHRFGCLTADDDLAAQEWPAGVKEEVLRAVVELRFYRLCMPMRERYLEFVDELLRPQVVDRSKFFPKVR